MPNFVCDICGGSIKMQANKTGICQNCGMEYDIDAIRAMAGNAAAKPASAPAPTPSAKSDELDRDALLIYLGDVRTLETIIKETKDKQIELKDKDDRLKQNLEIIKSSYIESAEHSKSMTKSAETETTLLDMEQKNRKKQIALFIILAIISIVIFMPLGTTPSNFEVILVPIIFISVGFGGVIIYLIYEIITHGREIDDFRVIKEQSINSQKLDEENKRETFNTFQTNYNQWKNDYNATIISLGEDMDETEKMLEKAYSLNIIPMQFRGIEGVYYLYDYLSTSNQSFSEALMQANFEALKKKIDEVIEKQSAQIVIQAQTNAKLDEIKAKNQQILETAQATMNNTAIAARYAQIAAVNTEVIAKLSAKQLAYQRAEFWLN